jgi:hypothetical protein
MCLGGRTALRPATLALRERPDAAPMVPATAPVRRPGFLLPRDRASSRSMQVNRLAVTRHVHNTGQRRPVRGPRPASSTVSRLQLPSCRSSHPCRPGQIATWPGTMDVRCAAKMASLSSVARSTPAQERAVRGSRRLGQARVAAFQHAASQARSVAPRTTPATAPSTTACGRSHPASPATTLPPDECGRTRRSPARRARSRSSRGSGSARSRRSREARRTRRCDGC